MKKMIIAIAMAAVMSSTVFAAVTETPMNLSPIPDLSGTNYGKGDSAVTYDDKNISGISNFFVMDSSKWFRNSVFSWDVGASGGESDFAPHLEAANDSFAEYVNETDMLYLFYMNTPIHDGANIFVTEFDIKLNTNTDSVRWYIPRAFLWHDGGEYDKGWRVFDSDGKIKGTDYEYPVNEWIHMKCIFEPAERRWNVYVTDEQGEHHVVTDKIAAIRNVGWMPSEGSRSVITICQDKAKNPGETRAGFSLDNYKTYYLAKPENNLVISPDDEAHVTDEDKVTFSVNSVGGSKVVFCVDGIPYKEFSVADTEKCYTYSEDIDFFAFAEGERTLTAKRIKSDGEEEVIGTRKVILEKTFEGNIKLNSVVTENFTAGHDAKATVSVVRRGDAENALVFMCLYNENGVLCKADSAYTDLDSAQLLFTLPDDYSTEKYKVMVYAFDNPMIISDMAELNNE